MLVLEIIFSILLEKILLLRLPISGLFDYSLIITLAGLATCVWMKWREDEYADNIIFKASLVMLFIYSISNSFLYANNQAELIRGTITNFAGVLTWVLIIVLFYRSYLYVRRKKMKMNPKYVIGYFVFFVSIIGFGNSVKTFIGMLNNIIQSQTS
jgi:hypothetical protein